MAVNINLLPGELKVSTGLSRVLAIVRMIGVIGLAAFLIFGLGLAAFFIFSSIELNGLTTTNTNLKNQLNSLSATQSQFFLIKDRVAKIKAAQAVPSVTTDLTDFVPFVASFQSSKLNELDFSTGKISATISFGSNKELSDFINAISTTDLYKTVNVTTFGFNPVGGYTVNMDITTKK